MTLICPSCQKDAVEVVLRRDGLDVFRCGECRYTYRTPLLGHIDYERYTNGAYHFATRCQRGEQTFAERFDHDYEVAGKRLDAIARYWLNENRIACDVGAGNGAFVAAALERGYCSYGVEPGSSIHGWLKREKPWLAQRMFMTIRPCITSIGLLTMHDVLEHVTDPFTVLHQWVDRCAPGALVVIEAPDPECKEADDLTTWRHTKPIEHCVLPTRAAWAKILDAVGCHTIGGGTPVPQKLSIYARKVSVSE